MKQKNREYQTIKISLILLLFAPLYSFTAPMQVVKANKLYFNPIKKYQKPKRVAFLLSSFNNTHREDRNALPRYNKAAAGMQIKKTTQFKTVANGSALLKNSYGHYYLIKRESHFIVYKNGTIKLLQGGMIRFPKKASYNKQLKFSWTPQFPSKGKTCTITLLSKHPIPYLRLRLKTKWNTLFYKEGKKNGWIKYVARFGIDCLDSRREQPIHIDAHLSNGVRFFLRSAILLYNSRFKRADPDGIFKRRLSPTVSYASVKSSNKPKHAFFKNARILIKQKNRIKKKRKKRKPYFPALYYRPTVRLPAAKLALYRKRKEIRKEYLIHKRALSSSTARQLWRGNFIYPAAHYFSSIFGESRTYSGGWAGAHRGIDIASPYNTAVKAPNNGIIKFAGRTVLCGNNIIIDHGRYLFSKIYHMKKIFVRKGQYVRKGQIIGLVGSTGISTGPHIHWEMWMGSTKIDPNQWVHKKSSQERTGSSLTPSDQKLADRLYISF